MLLLLERDQFVKLFKFGEIKISVNRFIDGFEIDGDKHNFPLDILDEKLPLFEQDHEVLIMEISKESFLYGLILGPDISLKIYHVKKIFPLSEEGSKYLIGRMNPLIVLQRPIFEKQIQEIKARRDFSLRSKACDALFRYFQVDRKLINGFKDEIEQGVKKRLGFAQANKKDTFIYHLICFDRNPIYPKGSIEYIFKVGSIFVEMEGGTETVFERGPMYKYLERNVSAFKDLNLQDSIQMLKNSSDSDVLVKELGKQYSGIDMITVGGWFLYFKDILNKNYDLKKIEHDIRSLKTQNPVETSIILQMIGMLFSFENLYSSIYELTSLPIFKNKYEPGVLDQIRNLKNVLQEEKEQSEKHKIDLSTKTSQIHDLEIQISKGLQSNLSSSELVSLQSGLLKEIDSQLFELIRRKHLDQINADFIIDFLRELIKKTQGSEPKGIPSEDENVVSEMSENVNEDHYSSDLSGNIVEEKQKINEKIQHPETPVIDTSEIQLGIEKEYPDTIDLKNKGKKTREKSSSPASGRRKKAEKNKEQVIQDVNSVESNKGIPELENRGNAQTSTTELKLFDPTLSVKNLKHEYFTKEELWEIIKISNESNILKDTGIEDVFQKAIANYTNSNSRVFLDQLLNKVDEIQKDFKFPLDVSNQLKNIISKIKE